ncbi:MAG TPA: S8 family serine peptidase [Candidatus Limnocylindrales bacterium]
MKITLITGDVVDYTYTADGTPLDAEVTAAPRPDGRPVVFTEELRDSSYYVYPSDATELLEADRLDDRLFDVAYLTRNGFTDDRVDTIPLIVKGGIGSKSSPSSVAKAQADDYWNGAKAASGTTRIWLDGVMRASLDASVPQIGAPQAWQAGYTGEGVTVAVLDTGVDAGHPDLAGKVAASASFINGQTVQDGHGHGTHVASTIAGSGTASGGRLRGVAPDARLLVGKVLADNGSGSESSIIAGMEWAAAQGADVINMSLGGCCTDGTDPVSEAVDELSARYPVLFVIAAGNNGAPMTVGTPGNADSALTVGAVDRQDRLAPFSSRGPRNGDNLLKPDIAGPGVGIVAARSAGTTLGTPVDDRYTAASGTSMATPHAAGAAALLAQQHPQWTAERIKAALVSTAHEAAGAAYEVGSGRVDVGRAVRQGVFGPSNVDFATIQYDPNPAKVTRELTYTNDTATPVTLELSASLKGILSIAPQTLTVPAGGTATATATFDPSKASGDTWYQGSILAESTQGDLRLRAAVGAYVTARMVTLRTAVIVPDGATNVLLGNHLVFRTDDGNDRNTADNRFSVRGAAETVLRIPAGTYHVNATATWRGADGGWNSAIVAEPEADLSADRTVTFDLRKAKAVTATTPKPSVDKDVDAGYTRNSASGATRLNASATSSYTDPTTIWTLPTKPVTGGTLTWFSHRLRVAPPIGMNQHGRPHETLHPRYSGLDRGHPRLDGRQTLEVVAVGNGKPAELAGLDLRGKLALVDLSDLCPVQTCASGVRERVSALAQAGAVGAIGFGGLLRPSLSELQPAVAAIPIPVMTLPVAEGRALASKAPVRIDVDSSAATPYMYTLMFPVEGRIPDRLNETVGNGQLFRADMRAHADGPGTLSLNRGGFLIGARSVGNTSLTMTGGQAITEYVGPAQDGLLFIRNASFSPDAPPEVKPFHANGWSQSRPELIRTPGYRAESLGQQPLVPTTDRNRREEFGPYLWQVCLGCRSGDVLITWFEQGSGGYGGFQAWASEGALQGAPPTEMRLTRSDGTEIPMRETCFLLAGIACIGTTYFKMPPEPDRYRLTVHHPTPYTMQRWARQVDTEWTFASQRKGGPGPTEQPVVNLGAWCARWTTITDEGIHYRDGCEAERLLHIQYDLGLELDNTAKAGRAHRISLEGFYHPYLKETAKVSTLKLWVSYDDGATWQRAITHREDGSGFEAVLHHPRLDRTTGAVSLRVEATDSTGNTVSQTIQRAYGLN